MMRGLRFDVDVKASQANHTFFRGLPVKTVWDGIGGWGGLEDTEEVFSKKNNLWWFATTTLIAADTVITIIQIASLSVLVKKKRSFFYGLPL